MEIFNDVATPRLSPSFRRRGATVSGSSYVGYRAVGGDDQFFSVLVFIDAHVLELVPRTLLYRGGIRIRP